MSKRNLLGDIFSRVLASRIFGIVRTANGGTGSATAAGARTNLDVYSKSETDDLVVGLLDDRGNYDASVNTFPASGGSGSAGAVLKGDIWLISVAGTLGGVAVEIGDSVRALVDTPGQTASNWAVMQKNYGDTITNTIFRTKTVEESLSDTRVLTETEGQSFNFDPNGANRTVKMYASPSVGDRRRIRNSGSSGYNLTVQDNAGSSISGASIADGVEIEMKYFTGGWVI